MQGKNLGKPSCCLREVPLQQENNKVHLYDMKVHCLCRGSNHGSSKLQPVCFIKAKFIGQKKKNVQIQGLAMIALCNLSFQVLPFDELICASSHIGHWCYYIRTSWNEPEREKDLIVGEQERDENTLWIEQIKIWFSFLFCKIYLREQTTNLVEIAHLFTCQSPLHW